MSIGISCLFILIAALVVLSMAFLIIQRQRMLKEKKSQYMTCRMKHNFHNRRYQGYQKDIERLRSIYNNKVKDIILLFEEISNKKKLITEGLEILREEVKQNYNRMNHDSDRIVARRKDMIRNYWQELNGKKAACLEKLKQARSDQFSLPKLEAKKNDEFRLSVEIKSELGKIEDEYNRLLRNPILPFKIENNNHHNFSG